MDGVCFFEEDGTYDFVRTFFKVMQMKHEPHGAFYNIVCYYCCSPCNWNFLHSSVYCSYTILWTTDIYKMSNNFFLSHDAYHAEYCRWTHYLVTNDYRVHTPFFCTRQWASHCNPDRVRGGHVRLALLKGARFSYLRGTDERYILFKVTALNLNDTYSFVSNNLCSMRNLGQLYATKCVWL